MVRIATRASPGRAARSRREPRPGTRGACRSRGRPIPSNRGRDRRRRRICGSPRPIPPGAAKARATRNAAKTSMASPARTSADHRSEVALARLAMLHRRCTREGRPGWGRAATPGRSRRRRHRPHRSKGTPAVAPTNRTASPSPPRSRRRGCRWRGDARACRCRGGPALWSRRETDRAGTV